MKRKATLFSSCFFCFALVTLFAAQAIGQTQPVSNTEPNKSAPIPMDQLGAVAGKQYHGDGLSVSATPDGARLRCAFQRLEGHVTHEGLWLSSTADNSLGERFRVMAVEVGRADGYGVRRQSVAPTPLLEGDRMEAALPGFQSGVATSFPPQSMTLPVKGTVLVKDHTARFIRDGLTEEYTVSVDGVRQDFILEQRPGGEGALRVELDVTGAKAEPLVNGVRLVLDGSGRKLAYNRLRVVDTTGRELPARMEVAAGVSPAVEDGILPPGKGARTIGVSGFHCDPFARSGISAGLEAAALRQAETPAATRLAVLVDDAGAIYPVRIDPTFSDANWMSMGGFPGPGGINATAVDNSGNLYVAGFFLVAGDLFANRIAKWNGSGWSALGSGMNNEVLALAVSGSNLYAGGRFTTAGGSAANRIAKWNGSSWSALGSGLNDDVYALVVSGGDLYAGGGFTTAGGSLANRIARWNGNGWSALGSALNNIVYALAVSGSNLYVGGAFTTAGGSPANYIGKWNGSAWSTLGSGMDFLVRALAASGNDLYVGGDFTTATNTDGVAVTVNRVAKWDGSNWSALGSGMNSAGYVRALAVSGSDVYAGGIFSTAGGGSANYIAKWDGSSWSALESGMDGEVRALAVSASDLFAGGIFSTAGGKETLGIAKWSGSNWTALNSGWLGLNEQVKALAVSGSNVFVGGWFTIAGGSTAYFVSKWNSSGWSPVGSGMNGHVWALAVSGSDLYAAGEFTRATNGGGIVVTVDHIAKWDGSNWTALGSGLGGASPPYVSALAVSGSDVYAGGSFTTAGGSTARYVAKWNGSSWATLSSGMNNYVYALAVAGSNIYVGGNFTTAGGIPAGRIAKWNGNSWAPLGLGINAAVRALSVSGSDVYAGGDFARATNNGGAVVTANRIAKWDGSSWSALGSGMGGVGSPWVAALAVSGNDVYAGGFFGTAGGNSANFIAKWNGNIWTALGSGMNSYVTALAVTGSDLYAGGGFQIAGGKVSGYIARAYLPTLPTLSVFRSGSDAIVTWPSVDSTDFALEQAGTLAIPVWITNTASIIDDGTNKSVTIPATNAAQLFRLRRP